MQTWHFVWMLAAATGLTASGLAGSGWALATGERPTIWILSAYSVMTPVRAAVLAVYAPLALIRTALDDLAQSPILAVIVGALGLGWSFLQGVFILTAFFGFT